MPRSASSLLTLTIKALDQGKNELIYVEGLGWFQEEHETNASIW